MHSTRFSSRASTILSEVLNLAENLEVFKNNKSLDALIFGQVCSDYQTK